MEVLGGPLFAVAGAGESHGPAITTIVFGCPAGTPIVRQQIQRQLDRRRPGGNKYGTPRNESDQVAILSGVFQDDADALLAGPEIRVGDPEASVPSYDTGFATGEPIAAVVLSTAKKSRDYTQFQGPEGQVRPGHTDLVKHYKSRGFVDIRGGGRSSYRSTISDVIGGAIARDFLHANFGTVFLSSISHVGELAANIRLDAFLEAHPTADLDELERTILAAKIPSIDETFADQAAELIRQTRIDGDSLGAAVDVVVVNPPALIGEPLYHSLKDRLMGSLGGLHAVRSCELGSGRDVVARRGSENNDPIRADGYQSNHHGGMLGGITTGQPIVCRIGFKPTSTISKAQQSVRKNLEEIDFRLEKGRHDPCVGVRAGVTLEARAAIEIMNAVLMHQAGRVDPAQFKLFP